MKSWVNPNLNVLVFWSHPKKQMKSTLAYIGRTFPISKDAPKNVVIWLDIESSSVVESPPDSSFREVIGTNDIDLMKLLITCINKHGPRY